MKKKEVEWWTFWSPRKNTWWPEVPFKTKKALKKSLFEGREPNIPLKGVKITKEDL